MRVRESKIKSELPSEEETLSGAVHGREARVDVGVGTRVVTGAGEVPVGVVDTGRRGSLLVGGIADVAIGSDISELDD